MAKKNAKQRGTEGTLASGNQSEKEIGNAGEWANAAFRGDRDGKLKVPRKKQR